ncbi:MAG: hypothetical protein AABW91_02095 [Nanoarchaeota archaeon]
MHNKYILPNIYEDKEEDRVEAQLVETLLPKYLSLKLSGKTNKGNRIALMVSPTNGSGSYSSIDYDYHLNAGRKYKLVFGKNATLFDSASSRDLKEVVQDSDFASIFVIGHANYHSWRASDKSVNWFDLGQMVNGHLKNGIFANVGCGGIHSWNMIPLGYFIVTNQENLLGYEAEYADADSLGDLSKLKKLKRMPPLFSLI